MVVGPFFGNNNPNNLYSIDLQLNSYSNHTLSAYVYLQQPATNTKTLKKINKEIF